MEQKEIEQEQQLWLKVAATEEFGHRQDMGPDEDLLWHEGHYQVEVRMEEGWFPSGDPTPATCPKEPDGGCASTVPRLPRRGRWRERKGGRRPQVGASPACRESGHIGGELPPPRGGGTAASSSAEEMEGGSSPEARQEASASSRATEAVATAGISAPMPAMQQEGS
ncbi:UNVERIFIED_CONTAM: hypothetical protein FKN15_021725 [Acipenser sinensis]